MVRNQEELID
jgi:hypothetical protein